MTSPENLYLVVISSQKAIAAPCLFSMQFMYVPANAELYYTSSNGNSSRCEIQGKGVYLCQDGVKVTVET